MDTPTTSIPQRSTCLQLMDDHGMLPNIKAHSMTVCGFALSLARAANQCGCSFDLAMIEAAALLHDITKTRSLTTDEDHARTGAELLRELGFCPIAGLVEGHVTPADAVDGLLTAEELISYADKRVLHDRVVPLEERFGYLFERYGHSQQALERISLAKLRTREIEEKLRSLLQNAPGPIWKFF